MSVAKLENFAIAEKLIEKPFYTAYDAIDKKTEKRICLKLLHPSLNNDQEAIKAFVSSARVAKRLKHPGIQQVLNFGADEGFNYISSEPIEYRPFSHLIKDRFELAYDDLVKILTKIAETLRFAHLKGQVHGLLNPESIYVNSDCDVKLDDFGFHWMISRILDHEDRDTLYCAQYIAPEYYAAPELIDGQGDIYSLGVILYELINGKPPFQGDSLSEIQVQHLKGRIPGLNFSERHLPELMGPFIAQSMSRFKERRFQNLTQFLDSMRNLPNESETITENRNGSSKKEESDPSQIQKSFGLTKTITLGAGLLVILVAIIWGINFIATSDPNPAEVEQAALLQNDEGSTNLSTEPDQISEQPPENNAAPESKDGLNSAEPDENISSGEVTESASVKIEVRTQNRPGSANIFLDDEFIGKTSRSGILVLKNLDADYIYSLRVFQEGYTPVVRDLQPSQFQDPLRIELVPRQDLFAKVILDALPQADEIYIDGKQQSEARPLEISLEKGSHRIKFTNKALQQEFEQEILVKAGQILRIKHDFTVLEYGKVAVSLANAFEFGFGYVYVDGKIWPDSRNTTPLELSLPVGAHIIELKREGFKANPPSMKIEIKEDETQYISFRFTRAQGAN